jgi:threonine dehydrogenase-like Zn-dependent dehydrogenase
MKALLFERKLARYAAAAASGRVAPGSGAAVGPLRLADVEPIELPGPDWVRVRPRLSGICGSDLSTIDGRSSRYWEPLTSFPFVPGHEIVGDTDGGGRVVVVPILTCVVRGVTPMCPQCEAGAPNRCERTAYGHLEHGIQTGFCESTGGGWSTALAAHPSQLVPVPDDLTDEQAVLVEPAACAVHAARAVPEGAEVAVIGAGSVGLLTTAAIRHLRSPSTLLVTAKHPAQQALARRLGADKAVPPGELGRAIRLATGSWMVEDRLTGGFTEVVDCVGSADSLHQALSVVAPGGTVHVVGMPGHTSVDLTGLWYRELSLKGCYAYQPDDFLTAIELVREADLGRLVSALYPLSRYKEALTHAAQAGARGAVKIAFDLRAEKERNR